MVEIALTPQEYELIEKWFGLLYGNEDGQRKPSRDDLHLFQKLAFMHLSEMQQMVDDEEDDK